MTYPNLEQNPVIADEVSSPQTSTAAPSVIVATAADDEAHLGENLTWGQIKDGYKEYRQRAASARAAAKAAGA